MQLMVAFGGPNSEGTLMASRFLLWVGDGLLVMSPGGVEEPAYLPSALDGQGWESHPAQQQ